MSFFNFSSTHIPIICACFFIGCYNNTVFDLSRAAYDVLVAKMGENIANISSGFKGVSSQMDAFIAKSEHQPLALPTAGDPSGSSGVPFHPSGPSRGRLVLTGKPLPQLDRTEFPGVKLWLSCDYNERRKTSKGSDKDALMENGRKVSVLSCFMEDENGDPVDSGTMDRVRKMTKEFFWLLMRNEMAPAKWGDAGSDIADELVFRLETNFPWFRFCEGHWKSKQVATNSYPQWYPEALAHWNKEKKEKLEAALVLQGTASQPPDAEVIDVDADSDPQERPPKRRLAEGGDAGRPKRPRLEGARPSTQPAETATNRQMVCHQYHSYH